jgi:hypothetical protein
MEFSLSSKDDAFRPFLNIKKRLQEVCDALGLDVERFMVLPDEGTEIIQAVLVVRPDAVMSEAEKEQKRFDEEFARMEKSLVEDSVFDEKKPSMREDLEKWLNDD